MSSYKQVHKNPSNYQLQPLRIDYSCPAVQDAVNKRFYSVCGLYLAFIKEMFSYKQVHKNPSNYQLQQLRIDYSCPAVQDAVNSSIGTWGNHAKNHKINNPNFLNY